MLTVGGAYIAHAEETAGPDNPQNLHNSQTDSSTDLANSLPGPYDRLALLSMGKPATSQDISPQEWCNLAIGSVGLGGLGAIIGESSGP